MGISVVIPPAVEPLTLDEAMQHCRVVEDEEAGLVTGFIFAARTFVEKMTRLTLIQQSFLYTLDFKWPLVQCSLYDYVPYTYWRTRIELPKCPVISVSAVQYVDINGNLQTLDPTQYITVLDSDVSYIEPRYGVAWPEVRYQPQAITVQFSAGFGPDPGSIPENIRQALKMLVAFYYDNRGSAQFSLRVSGAIQPPEFPPGVEALLSTDRVSRIL